LIPPCPLSRSRLAAFPFPVAAACNAASSFITEFHSGRRASVSARPSEMKGKSICRIRRDTTISRDPASPQLRIEIIDWLSKFSNSYNCLFKFGIPSLDTQAMILLVLLHSVCVCLIKICGLDVTVPNLCRLAHFCQNNTTDGWTALYIDIAIIA
jgi:hypothetical protein